jgi:hypothetical protein
MSATGGPASTSPAIMVREGQPATARQRCAGQRTRTARSVLSSGTSGHTPSAKIEPASDIRGSASPGDRRAQAGRPGQDARRARMLLVGVRLCRRQCRGETTARLGIIRVRSTGSRDPGGRAAGPDRRPASATHLRCSCVGGPQAPRSGCDRPGRARRTSRAAGRREGPGHRPSPGRSGRGAARR